MLMVIIKSSKEYYIGQKVQGKLDKIYDPVNNYSKYHIYRVPPFSLVSETNYTRYHDCLTTNYHDYISYKDYLFKCSTLL